MKRHLYGRIEWVQYFDPNGGGDGFVPKMPEQRDYHEEFDGQAAMECIGPFLSAGAAVHRRTDLEGQTMTADPARLGPSAMDLAIDHDNPFEIVGECFHVLDAAGWIATLKEPYYLTPSSLVIEAVMSAFGPDWSGNRTNEDGEIAPEVYFEAAARILTSPLSRVWYAANILSLLHVHHETFRAGFLWAEYKHRLRSETYVEKAYKMSASAKAGGEAKARDSALRHASTIGEIQRLRAAGHTVSNACRLAYERKYGSSPQANRQLWNRRRSKL